MTVNAMHAGREQIRSVARGIFQHALEERASSAASAATPCTGRSEGRHGLYDLASFSKLRRLIRKEPQQPGALISRSAPDSRLRVCVRAHTRGRAGCRLPLLRGGHPCPITNPCGSEAILPLSIRSMSAHSSFNLLSAGVGHVEKPSARISFADLSRLPRLVHSGAPIAQINAVRKHLSAVKADGWPSRRAGPPAFHPIPTCGQRAGLAGQRPDHARQQHDRPMLHIVQRFNLLPQLPEACASCSRCVRSKRAQGGRRC